jgi:hypothetical protein
MRDSWSPEKVELDCGWASTTAVNFGWVANVRKKEQSCIPLQSQFLQGLLF